MHYMSEISINNFKSIKEGKFFLAQYTPLVGYNNAGKSNLIQAIKWFIKPYSLVETDFNDVHKSIEIVGTIEGITQDILQHLTPTNQTKIKKFLFFNKIKFKRIQEVPRDGVTQIKLEVLDYGYGYIPDVWKLAPTGLPAALKEMFPNIIEIGAMENVIDDASKYKKSNTIGKLISAIIKPVEENYTEEFNKKLEGISNKINGDGGRRLKELKKFDKESTSVLNEFFPGIGLKVHIPTPNIQDLFQNSLLKVEEDGYTRNLQEYGHGTQRSIQMALVKYLSDIQTNNSSTSLLLIDEPELYLHPQAIEQTRIALKKLSKNGYQIIFSTHSPQMIVSEDVLDTLLIRKNNGITYSRKRMREALSEIDIKNKHKTQFELIMSLTNSNQILFSEKVVLIEGTTELRLFPTLFEKRKKRTLSTSHIALIEQNSSSSTQKMIKVLKSMDLPTKVIVDLDFAFRGAVKNNYLTASDIDPCKEYLATNKPSKMFLDADGFPAKKKGNSNFWNAAEGFEWLASQTPMKPIIENIHQKLKQENIWIWTKGAIEKHLNLKTKNEKAWMDFLENFGEKSFGRYIRDSKIKEMLDWIDE